MNLSDPTPIRDYEGVDKRRFLEEIRPLGQPAILRGLGRDWPAVGAAQESDEALIAYLRRFRTERPVSAIVGDPAIKGRFFYTDDMRSLNFARGRSPLDPFFDRLLRDRDNPAPYSIAVQSEEIPNVLPGFQLENSTDLVPAGTVPRAWMGNRIRVAPHYDLMENIGCVVAGRRRFRLYPPDQIANLYPGPIELTPAGTPVSLVDPDEPDLDRFPRYAQAAEAAQVGELGPGDAIYIPYHWWHGVDSLAPVNLFVNYWWSEAMKGLGSGYDALLFGIYAFRHLPPEQRKAWRMMFDYYIFRESGDPAEHLPEAAQGVLSPPTPEQLGRIRATIKGIAQRL